MVKRIGGSPGTWNRVGQTGQVAGFNWPAVAVLIPADADRERVLALLGLYEAGMLSGLAKVASKAQTEEE